MEASTSSHARTFALDTPGHEPTCELVEAEVPTEDRLSTLWSDVLGRPIRDTGDDIDGRSSPLSRSVRRGSPMV